MGWVAVWREIDLCCMFALVHNEQRERADKLRRGQPVIVMRDDHKTAGIAVVPRSDDPTRFLRLDTPSLSGPIDILPSLLRIWRYPCLVQYLQGEAVKTVSTVPVKTEQEVAREKDERRTVASADTLASALPLLGDSWLGALSPDTKDKVREERNRRFVEDQKNGKHNGKPKPR
jgi:hypothetical protein